MRLLFYPQRSQLTWLIITPGNIQSAYDLSGWMLGAVRGPRRREAIASAVVVVDEDDTSVRILTDLSLANVWRDALTGIDLDQDAIPQWSDQVADGFHYDEAGSHLIFGPDPPRSKKTGSPVYVLSDPEHIEIFEDPQFAPAAFGLLETLRSFDVLDVGSIPSTSVTAAALTALSFGIQEEELSRGPARNILERLARDKSAPEPLRDLAITLLESVTPS